MFLTPSTEYWAVQYLTCRSPPQARPTIPPILLNIGRKTEVVQLQLRRCTQSVDWFVMARLTANKTKKQNSTSHKKTGGRRGAYGRRMWCGGCGVPHGEPQNDIAMTAHGERAYCNDSVRARNDDQGQQVGGVRVAPRDIPLNGNGLPCLRHVARTGHQDVLRVAKDSPHQAHCNARYRAQCRTGNAHARPGPTLQPATTGPAVTTHTIFFLKKQAEKAAAPERNPSTPRPGHQRIMM